MARAIRITAGQISAAAELNVGVLNKHRAGDHDEARYFIELVK